MIQKNIYMFTKERIHNPIPDKFTKLLDVVKCRELLWEKYSKLSDEDILKIRDITINFLNQIFNTYLWKTWKMPSSTQEFHP